MPHKCVTKSPCPALLPFARGRSAADWSTPRASAHARVLNHAEQRPIWLAHRAEPDALAHVNHWSVRHRPGGNEPRTGRIDVCHRPLGDWPISDGRAQIESELVATNAEADLERLVKVGLKPPAAPRTRHARRPDPRSDRSWTALHQASGLRGRATPECDRPHATAAHCGLRTRFRPARSTPLGRPLRQRWAGLTLALRTTRRGTGGDSTHGSGWIRTNVGRANGFTARPL